MYYMPQQAYAPQQGYLPQQGYEPQQAYTQYPAYPQQAACMPQYPYAPPYAYAPPYETPAQPAAPAQLAAPAQFAATNPFTEWDFDELGPEAEEAPPESPSQAVPEPAAKKGKLSPKARKTLKLVQNTLFWAVCILLVAGSVLFAVSKDPRKNYLGYRIYSVKTESMTPKADGSSPPGGFRRGDLIIVKMCGPSSIKVNDIITFNPSTKEEDNQLFLTHRVVDVKTELAGKPGTYFVTKGDFNNSEDPPISAEMLIGKKVFSIPKVGSFLQKVRENFTLSIITILCFFACIFMFKWYFSSPKKKAGAAEETKPPQPPQLPRQPRAPQRYFSAVPEAAV